MEVYNVSALSTYDKKRLEPVAEALRTDHIVSMPHRYGVGHELRSPWRELTEDRREKWYRLAAVSYNEWYDTIYEEVYDNGYNVGYEEGYDRGCEFAAGG